MTENRDQMVTISRATSPRPQALCTRIVSCRSIALSTDRAPRLSTSYGDLPPVPAPTCLWFCLSFTHAGLKGLLNLESGASLPRCHTWNQSIFSIFQGKSWRLSRGWQEAAAVWRKPRFPMGTDPLFPLMACYLQAGWLGTRRCIYERLLQPAVLYNFHLVSTFYPYCRTNLPILQRFHWRWSVRTLHLWFRSLLRIWDTIWGKNLDFYLVSLPIHPRNVSFWGMRTTPGRSRLFLQVRMAPFRRQQEKYDEYSNFYVFDGLRYHIARPTPKSYRSI